MLRRATWIALTTLLLSATTTLAQAPYVRTVIVNSGLSPTVNGSTLLSQLAGITTASATNPWLLKVEPGIYDLGSGSLTMKDYVDIEGSGVGITVITSSQARGGSNLATISIPASTHAELRELTVKNTSSDAIGITDNSSNSSLLQLAIAIPSGSVSTFGILLQSSSPTLAKLSIQINSTANTAQGIYVAGGNPTITDVTIASTNGPSVVAAAGIVVAAGGATIDNATVTVGGATANDGLSLQGGSTSLVSNSRFTATSRGVSAHGVAAGGNAAATLNQVTATANISGSGGTIAGLYNNGATLEVNNSALVATSTSGLTVAYGLDSVGSNTAVTQINHSNVLGVDAGIALFNGTVRAGVSWISSAGSSPGTTLVCVGDYSGGYLPLNSLCA